MIGIGCHRLPLNRELRGLGDKWRVGGAFEWNGTPRHIPNTRNKSTLTLT